MHGIVSLLPSPFNEEVRNIWKHLDDEFGLQGIKLTPFPHFSWQIGSYPLQELEKRMIEVSREFSPFEIRTAGIGVFTGARPVIYIPVVKSPLLFSLHQMIWDKFSEVGEGVNHLYHPDRWTPHISLAYEDIKEYNIGDVMTWLAEQNVSWEMKIDNLAFIHEPEGKIGELKFQFPFQN
jgi:2'-5' RNA ligase